MTPIKLRTGQLHIFTDLWERSPGTNTMKPNHFNSILRRLFQRRRRESVANEITLREGAVSNAAEEPFDGTDDGWMKIAPFGSYPGSRPGRAQNFTEVEANAMVAEFSSLRGRLGRMFRGAPVYIGHPDANPAVYTDHRRLGKITDLQARADGLYGEVEWNALGQENLREGYWVYPSPRWDAPHGRAEFRPDRLISVGLTNVPRISGSEPVTNSQDFENDNQTNNDMDRKLLTEKLNLDVTATDEEILAKLTQMMSAAETAAADVATKQVAVETAENSLLTVRGELTTASGRITTLEGEVQTAREAHANSLLDTALTTGRIAKADREEWLVKLTGAQREAESNALAALKPTLNMDSLDVSGSRIQIGDAAARREAISNAVDAQMGKGLGYDEAYAAAKKDPTLKPVWDAMKTES